MLYNMSHGKIHRATVTEANLEYVIIHSNGVNANDKTFNLEGYTLYLDTLNVSGLELTANTVISNYQTIIAYKNIN